MATPFEQLEAMRTIPSNWDGYGAAVPQPMAIDLAQEFADLIESVLGKLSKTSWQLHVAPTRLGGVIMEWADAIADHEIEIFPDRSIGFLHCLKSTGEIQTRKFSPTDTVVHPGLLRELRHLLAA